MPPTIDPVEFGRLTAQVETLEKQVTDMQADVKSLLAMANKSRGALWLGMAFASAFSAVAGWAASHFTK